MPLNPQQIDRYSRQIIVPGVGGRAQERLLASRLILAGERRSMEPVLLYMTGAGVGTVEVAIVDDAGASAELADSMRHLNGDVVVLPRLDESRSAPDLVFAIIESSASFDNAGAMVARFPHAKWVLARIDAPPRIAVLPSPPPCARCAGKRLLSPPGDRAANASVVVMAATVEAFKLLAGYAKDNSATMIDFDGYESRTSRLAPDPNCDCAKTGA